MEVKTGGLTVAKKRYLQVKCPFKKIKENSLSDSFFMPNTLPMLVSCDCYMFAFFFKIYFVIVRRFVFARSFEQN